MKNFLTYGPIPHNHPITGNRWSLIAINNQMLGWVWLLILEMDLATYL